MALSPQTLSLDDRRRVASWAADCAEHVLAIFETAAPGDPRVRDAARVAPTPAAQAAAHAAEQAAACAHMGAHALGAAGYAAKAVALATTGDRDAALRSEILRQCAAMSDEVAAALASLPALGENAAGPLGPGRLTGSSVGRTIRAIQEALRDR